METGSNLPDDVNAWLTQFDQYVDQDSDSTILNGAISPVQRKAAQVHEQDVYEMVKLAAKYVVGETDSDIYVIRPKLPYTYVEHGPSIKPDIIVIIEGKDTKHIVIDAKNYEDYIQPKQWKKLKRDMDQVKADFGLLVLNETGYFNKNSEDEMKKNNITVINYITGNNQSVLGMVNYLGIIINQNFRYTNQDFQNQEQRVNDENFKSTIPNPYGRNKETVYYINHYTLKK
ncbi:unnamed protein product [Adineta steineri]|uniref:Restriction endonuclease type IV Mrr domain-containing protein n=1 Tax=Adineta steineri TaxID=433720 RepID=A0A814SWV3_9BILA|nr:unnamed protein product [Adineta steineri]CAF3573943.1 unnamed protein product [Adineta steineri]